MKSILLLFDVDGTLTPPREVIHSDMVECLEKIKTRSNVTIGFVGGSDLEKQKEQLTLPNMGMFEWRFSENGLTGYHDKELIHTRSFSEEFNEQNFQELINIILLVLSNIHCPVKRGTFIEYRNGMLNVSPIGRACTKSERKSFNEYDNVHHIRKTMIHEIQEKWNKYVELHHIDLPELQFSIGGEISVDIFPKGWDKTYCLHFVESLFDEIHFFGDKTHKGGNDYEIYSDKRVIGHHVNTYHDTIQLLEDLCYI